jgi:ankyrin repeat protein
MTKKPKAFEVQPRDLLDIVAHNELIMLQQAIDEDKSAVITFRDKFGTSAVHTATCHNHPRALEMLLEAGADINAQADDGSTALHIAADLGLTHLVTYLVNRGAKLDLVNSDFELPLQLARRNNQSRIVVFLSPLVEPLFQQSSDVFSAAAAGDLMYFVNLLDTSKLLVGQPFLTPIQLSDVNPKDNETVLTTICKQEKLSENHKKILELLLSRNASPINKQNGAKLTPLMLCTKFNHREEITRLLKYGADPTIAYDEEEGLTVSSLAKDTQLKLELLVEEKKALFEQQYAQKDSIPFNQRPTYVQEVKQLRRDMLDAQRDLADYLDAQKQPPEGSEETPRADA